MEMFKKKWSYVIASLLFVAEAIVLFGLNDRMYAGICDNLDLFITQLKMLHDGNSFFSHHEAMSMLNGIDRDYFPTECSLYNILFAVMPAVYAYITGYLLKLLIGFFSFLYFMKVMLNDEFGQYENLLVLVAVAFALLPVYPMYAICFSSIPLIVALLVKVHRKPEWRLFVCIFAYPLLSYFSFFGIFLLGYLMVAIVVVTIRERKIPKALCISSVLLFAGFGVFEYRLFGIMLFSDVETIRDTMVISSLHGKELWNFFKEGFLRGVAHAEDAHWVFVFPACMFYLVIHNLLLLIKKEARKILTDPFNLTILFLLANSVIYALYYWEPLRNAVETLLPPLKGFQFNRTIFFNPFLWYTAFAILLIRIFGRQKKISFLAAGLSIVIVMTTQSTYSDFYNTVYCTAYRILKQQAPNQLNFREFYGEELFEKVKTDISYDPSYAACAYGFHPAVLQYNGITTLDGYCGYYSQDYKEAFREVIAPTLEVAKNWQVYYDNWACRAYLFTPTGENIYDFGANSDTIPQDICINAKALKQLGCTYIFSRIEIVNAKEQGLLFESYYETDSIPYGVYVYRLSDTYDGE